MTRRNWIRAAIAALAGALLPFGKTRATANVARKETSPVGVFLGWRFRPGGFQPMSQDANAEVGDILLLFTLTPVLFHVTRAGPVATCLGMPVLKLDPNDLFEIDIDTGAIVGTYPRPEALTYGV